MIDSSCKVLRCILLLALILGQVGCATSTADLGYTPQTQADLPTNGNESHGWGAQ